MPNPIECIFTLIALFSLFLAISFLLSLIYGSNKRYNDPSVEKTDEQVTEKQGAKIYYIEKYKKPPVKRRKKKAQIALKGTILTPEEFKRINKE